MKRKILLFVFALLCVANIRPELKHFLPHSDAVMSILDYKYWFEGDTIIEGKRYTKVYRQYCTSETECGDLAYYAAVREDTIGEKIYALYPCEYYYYDCEEVLLADFDVQAEDQIEVYCRWPWFSSNWVTVEKVDSIWIDNQYRKRVKIVNGYPSHLPQDYWVEGIGSIAFGLFFPSPEAVADLGDTPKFLCLHLNGELLYRNPLYDTCFVKDSGVDIPVIVPPEDGTYCSVDNEWIYIDGSYTYRIYNAHGSLILSGISSSSAINISQLSGIYFIQLYDNTGFIHSYKFIKR